MDCKFGYENSFLVSSIVSRNLFQASFRMLYKPTVFYEQKLLSFASWPFEHNDPYRYTIFKNKKYRRIYRMQISMNTHSFFHRLSLRVENIDTISPLDLSFLVFETALMLNVGPNNSTQLQGTPIGPGRNSVGASSITSKVNTRRVIRVISIPRTRVMLVHRLLVPGILHRRRNGTIRATIIPNTLSSTIIEAWAAYFNGAMIARGISKSQSGYRSIAVSFVSWIHLRFHHPCSPSSIFR